MQPSSLKHQPATVRPGGAWIGVLALALCALATLLLLASDVVLALLGFVNLLANAWSQAAIAYLLSSTLGSGFLIFAILCFFTG